MNADHFTFYELLEPMLGVPAGVPAEAEQSHPVSGEAGRQVVVVTSRDALEAALPDILGAGVIGLDTETTGLDPVQDKVRLVQLAIPGCVYVIDCFKVDPLALAPVLENSKLIVGHNLKFDLKFLAQAGLRVPNGDRLFDTMLAAQLLGAGTPEGYLGKCGLGEVVERYLGIQLDKSQQQTDWSGTLSAEQTEYAAKDAEVLLPLQARLAREIEDAGLTRVAALEMRALPANSWLELSGAPFDCQGWVELSDNAVAGLIKLEQKLNEMVEPVDYVGKKSKTINWRSPMQVNAILRARGHTVENTDENTLRALVPVEPLADLILQHREANKRATSYGIEFAVKHVHPTTGRIHASYYQIGAASGRMACGNPNLQNIPRDQAYRGCFKPKEGRVLVKADYSQIELRIAAEKTGDPRMLQAYKNGEDLHRVTASEVMGIPYDEVTKEHRQAAKALNFGLIYGMGAARLQEYAASSYAVTLTLEQAEEFRRRFFDTYRGILLWHKSQPRTPYNTRTSAGRRRLGVEKFTEKLNTPIQGTGADGLKAALALLWETRDRYPSARLVQTVHDEIVIECDEADAEGVKEWLVDCMQRGMQCFLERVPVEVEAAIMKDWSG